MPLYGALQAKIVNVLVTDSGTALTILKRDGVDTERLVKQAIERYRHDTHPVDLTASRALQGDEARPKEIGGARHPGAR